MSCLITKNMKTLKTISTFSLSFIVVFSTNKCKYLIPYFTDEEYVLNEINDPVFKKSILLGVSNNEGMFLKESHSKKISTIFFEKQNLI